jgi:hypothetical protein
MCNVASLEKISGDERPSIPQILRTRLYYTTLLEASFQQNCSQSTLRNRNHLAYAFALFEYITQGLTPAVEVIERHLFRLDNEDAENDGTAEQEEMLMLYVKLLYRHADSGKGYYKPGQLREVLELAIKRFPNNSLFLAVFYTNECTRPLYLLLAD